MLSIDRAYQVIDIIELKNVSSLNEDVVNELVIYFEDGMFKRSWKRWIKNGQSMMKRLEWNLCVGLNRDGDLVISNVVTVRDSGSNEELSFVQSVIAVRKVE